MVTLAVFLFNVYTADIPTTVSMKCIYVDDIALAAQHKDIKLFDVTLKNYLSDLKECFITSKLNPAKLIVPCKDWMIILDIYHC